MEQNFTLNQCLRLVYNELTPEEGFMLKEIISSNRRLQVEYRNMRRAKRALSSISLSPESSVVDNILEYSRNSMLQVSQ